MNTIEKAICEGILNFEREYMGCNPKNINAYLINDLLIIRLQGVLTAAECQLAATSEKGIKLVKETRTYLIETARPLLEPMIAYITGHDVLALHHDISTITGEEIIILTLKK
jgi:uncharacterized protein YbcI